MKTSKEHGPQFDPADGTIGPLRLVRRWAMTHPETGLTWPAQQGRHTYATEGEAREILDGIRTACPASRYPGVHLLAVRAVWCYPGHFDPCGLCEPSPDPRPATRHTPGPWKVENRTEIASACGLVVCDIPGFCRGATTGPRQDADAALIAAAPELLEALEGLFRECAMIHKHGGEACNQKQANEAIRAAEAAINKATQQ